MITDPFRYYCHRCHQLKSVQKKLLRWDRLLVAAKIIAALSLPVVFLIDAARNVPAMVLVPLLLIGLFFIHDPFLKAIDKLKLRIRQVIRETDLLNGKAVPPIPIWMKPQAEHAWDADLNISGEQGLFAFFNRSFTASGKKILHGWLLEACSVSERLQRQDAVKELTGHIGFREDFLSAWEHEGRAEVYRSGDSLAEKVRALRPLSKLLLYGFQALALLALFLGVGLGLWWPLTLTFFGQLLVNIVSQRFQVDCISQCRGVWREIRQYRSLLEKIESFPFTSTKLKSLQDRLNIENVRPSAALRRLERYLQCLELRGSAIHPIVNNLCLWDLFWIGRLQAWMEQWGENLGDWRMICGEYEAYCSVATVAFNQPGWCYPEFVDDPLFIRIKDLGHPLLVSRNQTENDCNFPGPHHLCFISGPNMAGKSTYLRSVATAVIMAQAGLPVCAKYMCIGPLCLITSLSHSDSLTEGKSLFHKELDRLVMMWSMIESQPLPVFFMLDEMLRGTNPLDRYNGSLWFLRLLSRRRAGGMIATHDLRLTELQDQQNSKLSLQNHHFTCQITDKTCLFDFRLYPGVAPSVNAIPLMRQRGLPIPDPVS